MNYTPDHWVVLEFEGGTHRKVLGGWDGHGEWTWRLNSGIEHVADMGDHYVFYGYSGSTYTCYKYLCGMNGQMQDILAYWQHKDVPVEVVSV